MVVVVVELWTPSAMHLSVFDHLGCILYKKYCIDFTIILFCSQFFFPVAFCFILVFWCFLSFWIRIFLLVSLIKVLQIAYRRIKFYYSVNELIFTYKRIFASLTYRKLLICSWSASLWKWASESGCCLLISPIFHSCLVSQIFALSIGSDFFLFLFSSRSEKCTNEWHTSCQPRTPVAAPSPACFHTGSCLFSQKAASAFLRLFMSMVYLSNPCYYPVQFGLVILIPPPGNWSLYYENAQKACLSS